MYFYPHKEEGDNSKYNNYSSARTGRAGAANFFKPDDAIHSAVRKWIVYRLDERTITTAQVSNKGNIETEQALP